MSFERSPQDEPAGGQDRGHFGLMALVILAGLASVIMLISGSAAALKLALLASLWAAVVGFFLVTRYRREAAERETEMELREEVFQAELERLRADKGLPSAAESELLAEIKKDLASIRAQLEELSGRDYTYEPAALYAQARRIEELEGTANFTQKSSGAPSADAIAGRIGTTPEPGSPAAQDNPLASLIAQREHEAAQAKAQESVQAQAQPEPQLSTFDTGSFQAVKWDQGGVEQPAEVPSVEVPSAEPAAEPAPRESRRGRRRADGHQAGGISVAELMAQRNQKED